MSKPTKWYLILAVSLALMLTCSAGACANQDKSTTQAPDFTLQSIDGEEVTLSDLRGKPVIVDFWSIYCGSCMLQMPYLQMFYNKLSNAEVVLLTINIGNSAADARSFMTSQGLTFPVLLDTDAQVARAYITPYAGNIVYPVTFFIDSEGFFQALKLGPFSSCQEIEKAVKDIYPSVKIDTELKIGSEIDNRAPDFSLQTIDGKNMTLSSSSYHRSFVIWHHSDFHCFSS